MLVSRALRRRAVARARLPGRLAVGRARDGRARPRSTATRRRSSSASASSSRSCARPPSTGSSCCPSLRNETPRWPCLQLHRCRRLRSPCSAPRPTSASSSWRARPRARLRGDRRALPQAAAARRRGACCRRRAPRTRCSRRCWPRGAALQRGDEVRELRPWLYRIVHNTSLNALRVSGYDYAELHEAPGSPTTGDDELERRAVMRQTLASLAGAAGAPARGADPDGGQRRLAGGGRARPRAVGQRAAPARAPRARERAGGGDGADADAAGRPPRPRAPRAASSLVERISELVAGGGASADAGEGGHGGGARRRRHLRPGDRAPRHRPPVATARWRRRRPPRRGTRSTARRGGAAGARPRRCRCAAPRGVPGPGAAQGPPHEDRRGRRGKAGDRDRGPLRPAPPAPRRQSTPGSGDDRSGSGREGRRAGTTPAPRALRLRPRGLGRTTTRAPRGSLRLGPRRSRARRSDRVRAPPGSGSSGDPAPRRLRGLAAPSRPTAPAQTDAAEPTPHAGAGRTTDRNADATGRVTASDTPDLQRRPSVRKLFIVALALVAVLGLASSAAAKSRDRNHDKLPDRWERAHHLSLKVKQAKRDQDHDGLNNRGEFRAHMNPRDKDSDDDGIKDGKENAGTIKSFEGGVLTITPRRRRRAVRHGRRRHRDRVPARRRPRRPSSRAATTTPADDGPGHDAGDDQATTVPATTRATTTATTAPATTPATTTTSCARRRAEGRHRRCTRPTSRSPRTASAGRRSS